MAGPIGWVWIVQMNNLMELPKICKDAYFISNSVLDVLFMSGVAVGALESKCCRNFTPDPTGSLPDPKASTVKQLFVFDCLEIPWTSFAQN